MTTEIPNSILSQLDLLKKKVKKLEDELETKNIIINALIISEKSRKNEEEKYTKKIPVFDESNQLDNLMKDYNNSNTTNFLLEEMNNAKKPEINYSETDNAIKDDAINNHISVKANATKKEIASISESENLLFDNQTVSKSKAELGSVKKQKSEPQKDVNEKVEETAMSIEDEIKDVFKIKEKNMDFKINFDFNKFVEYSQNSYEFRLNNKKINNFKNPLNLYIQTNLDKILKYLIDRLNVFNLNQICSALFLINSYMDYERKLILFHDIVLRLVDFRKLVYIASAIFNNLKLKYDSFSQAISGILYHQITIDTKLLMIKKSWNIYR